MVVNSDQSTSDRGAKERGVRDRRRSGDAPDIHCIPVGNAGNITAYWKGYREYREAGRSTKLPKMLGFQAAGAAPIVHRSSGSRSPDTIATAIRIGNPASWAGATTAAADSGGSITAVTDAEILDAYRFLAAKESVFCEAASAASVAGLLKSGVAPGSVVVCVLTGHGLKDPDLAISSVSAFDHRRIWSRSSVSLVGSHRLGQAQSGPSLRRELGGTLISPPVASSSIR